MAHAILLAICIAILSSSFSFTEFWLLLLPILHLFCAASSIPFNDFSSVCVCEWVSEWVSVCVVRKSVCNECVCVCVRVYIYVLCACWVWCLPLMKNRHIKQEFFNLGLNMVNCIFIFVLEDKRLFSDCKDQSGLVHTCRIWSSQQITCTCYIHGFCSLVFARDGIKPNWCCGCNGDGHTFRVWCCELPLYMAFLFLTVFQHLLHTPGLQLNSSGILKIVTLRSWDSNCKYL